MLISKLKKPGLVSLLVSSNYISLNPALLYDKYQRQELRAATKQIWYRLIHSHPLVPLVRDDANQISDISLNKTTIHPLINPSFWKG